MKQYIRAMATSKQEAIYQIQSISGEIVEHLLKLYFFQDDTYTNHWRQEIWSFFHRVPKLKTTKKFPDANVIREAVGAYDDMVMELSRSVLDEYSALIPSRVDFQEAKSLILAYLDWISAEISKQGSVTPSEVYSKLGELGL